MVASAAQELVGRAKIDNANNGISAFLRNLLKFICDVLFILFLVKECIANSIPKRKWPITDKADFLFSYLAPDGNKIIQREVNMIDAQNQVLFFTRVDVNMMMFR
ncbi:hypothetical protein D3C74_339760 [compost metagenome]